MKNFIRKNGISLIIILVVLGIIAYWLRDGLFTATGIVYFIVITVVVVVLLGSELFANDKDSDN